MTVTAIIAEYNPFHNGHEYQLNMARKLTKADFIVVVMSGNYVQRGEPAIVNKWARTEMALKGGVDLVIELPLPYATSSAEYFATGAVELLNRSGVVDYLCFGSELGSVDELYEIAHLFVDEDDTFKQSLKESLNKGNSFPVARANALPSHLRTIAKSPNNILGIEYLKALLKTNSSIKPVTIQRIGSGYNDQGLGDKFSSASAIRKALGNTPDFEQLSQTISQTTKDILIREVDCLRGPVLSTDIFENLRYKIRSLDSSEIRRFPGVTEGLESKIKKAFDTTSTLEEAVAHIRSKRYPTTRISRSLLAIYLGLDTEKLNSFYLTGPTYLRVLGMRESSRMLLKQIKKNCASEDSETVLSMKLKPLVSSQQKSISDLAKTEMLSTDLYVLNYPTKSTFKFASQEFLTNPVLIK